MLWDYAELSKMASVEGGPEELVNKLFNDGVEQGHKEMLPFLFLFFGGGILIEKGVNYYMERRKKRKMDIEKTEKELVQGIKDYDNHSVDENCEKAGI